jgi:hypothetical protein
VNGDGRPDMIVGANLADNNGRPDSGSAYVVFGRSSPGTLDLAALGPAGISIDGAAAADQAGWSVVGVGDVNGDSRSDLLVGAYKADGLGRPDSGTASLLYGFGAPELAYPVVTATVGKPLNATPPKRLRRTGIPTFTVSPALPAGLNVDPNTGRLSGTPRVARPRTTYTVTMSDLAGSTTAPLSIQVRARADTTPPRLLLGGPQTQRLLAKKGIIVRAHCDEPARSRRPDTWRSWEQGSRSSSEPPE